MNLNYTPMKIHSDRIPTMGIQLGSSFSSLAVKHCDELLVTQDCLQIPSVVVFSENNKYYVGHDAAAHLEINPSHTIINFLQLLGRNYDNPIVQNWIKIAPYKVVSDAYNKPKILITTTNETKSYYPEEIAALILKHLTEIAKQILNQSVTHAVITVPAHFDDEQRLALRNACELAGINDLRLMSTPYASGFAYAVHRGSPIPKNYITFNLGGHSSEISWLNVEDGVFEIKANQVSEDVSGEAFTQMITNYVENEIQDQFGINIHQANINLQTIIRLCQKAKCDLSQDEKTTIDLGKLGNQDVKINITRQIFDKICSPLYEEIIKILDQFIKEANIDVKTIEDTILIGSSTLIYGVQETIKKYFGGRQPLTVIHPQQVRAIGAVQQADQLCNTLPIYPLGNGTKLSLGIETSEGIMTVVIPRNTPTPVTRSIIVTTQVDLQTNVLVKIYEGERYQTKFNLYRGELVLEGIDALPHGVAQLEVKVQIDSQNNVSVKLKELISHKTAFLRLQQLESQYTNQQIEETIQDAQSKKDEDQLVRIQLIEKQQKDYLQKLLSFVVNSSFNNILSEEERSVVKQSLQLLSNGIDIQVIMITISPLLYKHELQEELFKEGQNLVGPINKKNGTV